MFLSDLDLLLDWTQSSYDIDSFEKDFTDLVHKHRKEEGVIEIANIVAHNYDCHKHNRQNAVIHNMKQWAAYKKEP